VPWFRSLRWAVLLIAVATVLAMGSLAQSDFFEVDDPQNIAMNPDFDPPTVSGLVHHWTRQKLQLYVPVTYTVWHAVAMLAHTEKPDALGQVVTPMPFKIANLIVHAIGAVLMFAVVRRWLTFGTDDDTSHKRAWIAALCGALVVAVHPMQVESIGWGSGTKDLLMAAFSVAALLAYSRSVERSIPTGRAVADWRLHGLAIFLTLLALLSKPTAMVLPVLLIAIDYLVYRRGWKQVAIAVVPFVPIAAGLAVVARQIQQSPNMTQLVEPMWRPLLATDAIAFYLGKLVWPHQLAFDYGRTQHEALASGTPYWSWAIVIAIGVVLALLAKRQRDARWLLPAVLFVVPLGPVLGLVAFDYMDVSAVADHYLALPMAGVGLLVALLLARLATAPGVWRAGLFAVVLVVIALGVRSRAQSAHYRDAVTYIDHALKVNPDSWQTISIWSNRVFIEALAEQDKLSIEQLREQFDLSRDLAWKSIRLYDARPGMAEARATGTQTYPRATVDYFRLAVMNSLLAIRPETDSAERERLLAGAQDYVKEAILGQPNHAIYWTFATRLFIQRGNARSARQSIERLRMLDPGAPEIAGFTSQIEQLEARSPPTTQP
jgi:protein O-mannosyl-transferase